MNMTSVLGQIPREADSESKILCRKIIENNTQEE